MNTAPRSPLRALIRLLAERWEVWAGGRAWTFHLCKGIPFHGGQGEVTAEDVEYTFAAIAQEGSASGLAPEFQLLTREGWPWRHHIQPDELPHV